MQMHSRAGVVWAGGCRAAQLMQTLQPESRKHLEEILLAALLRCTFKWPIAAAEVRSALDIICPVKTGNMISLVRLIVSSLCCRAGQWPLRSALLR